MGCLLTVIEGASLNPVTVPCVFFVFFFDFISLLIYLFKDIIHYHFQTISFNKYRFNDCKQCISYWVDAFSGISHIYVPCLIMSHLMGTLYKCKNCFPIMLRGYMWKYDTIKVKKNEWRHWLDSNLRIMENKWISDANHFTYCAIQANI